MTAVELLPPHEATPAITAPGVYNLSDEAYHADPVPGGSLSVSGARRLLPPSCPALYAYERGHGRAPKADWDFGHAAHGLVLGKGAEIEVIRKTDRKTGEVSDASDRKTDSAKEHEAAIRDAGKVPMLAKDLEMAKAMETALRAHPLAARLFDPLSGKPEQSLFRQDPDTGVWLRARLDWLENPPRADRHMIVPDYKTCDSASPEALRRNMFNFGYYMQAAWYLDMVVALGLAEEASFVFVCQEKRPPYLVTIVELEPDALDAGRAQNRRAIERYRDCVAAGVWPAYADDVVHLGLPRWADYQLTEDYT